MQWSWDVCVSVRKSVCLNKQNQMWFYFKTFRNHAHAFTFTLSLKSKHLHFAFWVQTTRHSHHLYTINNNHFFFVNFFFLLLCIKQTIQFTANHFICNNNFFYCCCCCIFMYCNFLLDYKKIIRIVNCVFDNQSTSIWQI